MDSEQALPERVDSKTAEPILLAEQLSWRAQNKQILDELTFSIRQGEFVGIIGPNGAGKSSLLRCLYGVIQPSAGKIYINQKEIGRFSRRQLAQKLAVVLQEPPSRFELSVEDVIGMGLTPHKSLLSFDSLDDKKLLRKAAVQVDLRDKLTQQFNSLSGGEKQRAMIARAIVQRPDILLMDEPTNHLDIRHQFEVLQLAKNLGITVIVSIHDLNLAAAFCDRIILLNNGQIVASGQPEAVLTEDHLDRVFKIKSLVDRHPFNHKLRITFKFQENQMNAGNHE